MMNRSLLAAVLLALGLSACGDQKPPSAPPTPITPKKAAAPAPAPAPEPASAPAAEPAKADAAAPAAPAGEMKKDEKK